MWYDDTRLGRTPQVPVSSYGSKLDVLDVRIRARPLGEGWLPSMRRRRLDWTYDEPTSAIGSYDFAY